MSSLPETPSSPSPYQAVIISDLHHLDSPQLKPERLPNTTLLSTSANRRSGAYQTVQTSSGLTLTNLPTPKGRMANYSLQKKVMSEAQLFVFLVTTTHFSKSNLVKCPRDVPSLCWIDNSNEEQAISEWKRQERERFLTLSQTVIQNEEQKKQDSKLSSYRFFWSSRPHDFPITSFEKVEKIVRNIRPETEVFSCRSTSLKKLLKNGDEMTQEFTMEWERLVKRATALHSSQKPDRQVHPRSKKEKKEISLWEKIR